jgi:hypothetical protein
MKTDDQDNVIRLENDSELRKPWQPPAIEVLMVDQTEIGNHLNLGGLLGAS